MAVEIVSREIIVNGILEENLPLDGVGFVEPGDLYDDALMGWENVEGVPYVKYDIWKTIPIVAAQLGLSLTLDDTGENWSDTMDYFSYNIECLPLNLIFEDTRFDEDDEDFAGGE